MRTELQESKPQRWRALIVFRNGKEALLVLGLSHVQVRETYNLPWFEIFDDEEHSQTKEIQLQKWVGLPDCGTWISQGVLPIPSPRRIVI